MTKTSQLQIRVSEDDKARIHARATRAGMDVSKWVLRQLLPPVEERFQALCRELAAGDKSSYVLADLNDFLSGLSTREFAQAVRYEPAVQLPAFEENYLAAMVEHAAWNKKVPAPQWTKAITPLDIPWFASSLMSLRLHLLTCSPPAFRRRNLFVDSSIGDRV